MQLEGIDHVALSVRNVADAARCYAEVLGFKRQHADVWGDVPAFVGKGTTAIALFPGQGAAKSGSRDRTMRMLHLAFRADRKNFLAAREELKRRRIDFEFEDHAIAHSIYFQDPDGHNLEITTYEV